MDGYASKGSALILGGMKVTLNADVPTAIIADVDVIKNAPFDMIQAGYGDIIGKFSCLNDWKLSHVVNGEYICDYVYNATLDTTKETLNLASKLTERDPEAVCALMKALVTVGILMAYVGNSRPASGSEHHLSHYFEIVGILNDEPYFPHGVDVCYSAIETCKLREQVLAIKNVNELEYSFDKAAYEAEIKRIYTSIADEIFALQNKMGWYDVDRVKAIEGDPLIRRQLERHRDMAPEVIDGAVKRCSDVLGDPPDVVLAETRYGVIAGLVKDVVRTVQDKVYLSEKIDKFAINRFLGMPIFFGMMYLVFWITQIVGGAFIDFFEIAGDTLFVSGTAHLLGLFNAPAWLVALVSNGVGSALKTVGTFLPPVGFMFLCLSVLEDSGYMSRAAFVMDRFMRWIGLPGKSFVPMLVGFGCTVPAIMATRTLESKRDRFLTVFMTPFMSCGAKLPIWVLFAAAFFPENPGKLVFFIYLTGVVLGIVTGLILKHTLFQGEPTHFIMELPPYHLPRARHIFLHTWERLKVFIWRAGKLIVPMVLVLGMLNTVGTDGSIGNDNREESLLSVVGKAITPVFEPIGVEKDNWPASVSVFSGLFAKESLIGTMKGLYGQMDAAEASAPRSNAKQDDAGYSLVRGLKDAVLSIPANLSGVVAGLVDPLGFQGEKDAVAEASASAENVAAVNSLRRHFPKGVHQMFSFLLFVLLYIPCLAATGVVFREIGKLYGVIFVCYLTLLGWSVATVYHAVMVSHSALWLAVGSGILFAMFGGFWCYGKKHRIDML